MTATTLPAPPPELDDAEIRDDTGCPYVLYIASRGPIAVSGDHYGQPASYGDLYAAVR